MKKKLPFIIVLLVILAAFLVALPFSPRILHAVKNRLHELKTSALATPIPTSSAAHNGSWGPLISRFVPAFTNSVYNPATEANDDSYDSLWRSSGTPAWLAYDLSKVPAANRSKVLVVWYNESGNYDHTIINTPSYNMPQDYTIEVNAATGGGDPPENGWITKVTVRGNHYHSRQHVIDMAGYNWIRMNVTASDGYTQNFDASVNMDIYDAQSALTDDWIFFGDSITELSMGHSTANGVAAFAQLINKQSPDHYPVQEAGGIGYLTSADAAKYLPTWLALFPGKYAGLSYGTNDALGCADPAIFYNTYTDLIKDVLQAGKVPLVPRIPWGRQENIQQCAPALNAQIDKLYKAFPQIIHGPDLWSYFQKHPDLISDDNIHPNEKGSGAYRQQWADTMLAQVYKK